MSRTQKKLPAHIHHYHRQSRLLFQFILSEFITISEIVSRFSGDEKKTTIAIHELAGSTPSTMRIFAWNLDDSPVAKLKNYTALFSQDKSFPEKERLGLRRLASALWTLSLQCLDLIQEHHYDKKELKTLLQELEERTKQISKSITQLIAHFHEDENILFFLLRHHAQCDDTFGKRFCARLFKQTSAKFLVDRYKKRKFDSLIPQIERHMEKLR